MSTVQVGCKLPNGMILELGKPGDQNYTRVVLNGSNRARIAVSDTAGGYGITEVDENFWNAWRKKHGWLPAVKGEHVFAVGDVASAQAKALENSSIITGLEPMDPDKAPSGVEADADHLKAVKRAANGGDGART